MMPIRAFRRVDVEVLLLYHGILLLFIEPFPDTVSPTP
jgi:hypothetical protein